MLVDERDGLTVPRTVGEITIRQTKPFVHGLKWITADGP